MQQIASRASDVLVFSETAAVTFPYETHHPFEIERDRWESEHWFGGQSLHLKDVAQTEAYASINDGAAIDRIRKFAPTLTITFGTGKLGREVIVTGGKTLLNLHGGDPEAYRGLDTHLWAIWHHDFAGLQTCLHHVSEGLDEGDIVATLPIGLWQGMEIHQLRQANTEVCVRLAELAITELSATGTITCRRQRLAGRYYSAMPTALKDICLNRFRKRMARMEQ